MNREKFFDLFGVDIKNTIYCWKDECDFCKNQIGRSIFVKVYKEQQGSNHACYKCFCDKERDFYIEIKTNQIDLIEIEENND